MEYLFHYTNEKNIDDILNKETLLINNIDQTNDPYENKMFDMYDKRENRVNEESHYDSLIRDEIGEINISSEYDELYELYAESDLDYSFDFDNSSFYEREIYSNKIENKINQLIKKKMDHTDNDKQIYFFRHYTNMKNRITKTISFSIGEYNSKIINESNRPGYLYPRMWAQYGNKSRGICFVFNKDVLINEIYTQLSSDFYVFANPIKYVDILDENHANEISNLIKHRNRIFRHQNEYKGEMLIKNMLDNIGKYFFMKDKDWEGEREFRILIINKPHNKDINPKIIKLDMAKVLHCVVLGENFSYRNENEKQIDIKKELEYIKSCCHKKKIKLNIIKRDIYRSRYILDEIL